MLQGGQGNTRKYNPLVRKEGCTFAPSLIRLKNQLHLAYLIN